MISGRKRKTVFLSQQPRCVATPTTFCCSGAYLTVNTHTDWPFTHKHSRYLQMQHASCCRVTSLMISSRDVCMSLVCLSCRPLFVAEAEFKAAKYFTRVKKCMVVLTGADMLVVNVAALEAESASAGDMSVGVLRLVNYHEVCLCVYVCV